MIDGKTLRDHMAALEKGTEVYCFQKVPQPGDALLHRPVGGRPVERRPAAVPAPTSRASASTRRTRRSPGRPGRATTGSACELDSDAHRRPQPRRRRRAPRAARPRGVADREAAGRLAARAGHGARRGPARLQRLAATSRASTRDHDRRHRRRRCNAEIVDRTRSSGISEGVPGQRFVLKRGPVVPGRRAAACSRSPATRAGTSGRRCRDFADSGPDDRHFALDVVGRRGPPRPGRPPADGALRRYGAVPAKGAHAPAARVPHRRRARAATSSAAARSACSSRRSRSCPRSRTGARRAAASTARTSRTRRSAARSGCAPAAAPSRPRTTSSSPARPRRRWPACARSPRATAPTRARCACWSCPSAVSELGRLRFDQLVPNPDTLAEDHRPARGEPRHRHARDRRAARLPRRHGRRQAAGALAGQPDAPPGGRARSRCTSTSTRSPAAPTAPAGRSGGRSTRARSTRCSRASAARSSSRTRGCSAPTRSPASAASRPSASSSRPHALVFSYEHQVLVEGA